MTLAKAYAKESIGNYSTTRERMDSTINQLVSDLLPYVVNRTVVDGGNFQIRDGIYLMNYAATATFEVATQLCTRARSEGKDVTQTFLVDDFGLVNNSGAQRQFEWPNSYLEIMARHGISPSEVKKFYETNLRNRADTTFRKFLKLIREEKLGGAEYPSGVDPCSVFDWGAVNYFYIEDHKTIPLARNHAYPNRKLTSQFGPSLLAQKLRDHESACYNLAINFMSEESYVVKDDGNAIVYYNMEGEIPVINVYFRERDGVINIDVTKYVRKVVSKTPFFKPKKSWIQSLLSYFSLRSKIRDVNN